MLDLTKFKQGELYDGFLLLETHIGAVEAFRDPENLVEGIALNMGIIGSYLWTTGMRLDRWRKGIEFAHEFGVLDNYIESLQLYLQVGHELPDDLELDPIEHAEWIQSENEEYIRGKLNEYLSQYGKHL